MPDDRELAATGAAAELLADATPGDAALSEEAVSLAAAGGRRRPLGIVFWLAVTWVGIVVIAAIFANLLPLAHPNFQNYSAINTGPSIHHLLGTDDLGRDLLSRLIFGARVSLVVGFGSIAIGMIVGGSAGLVSAYLGGGWDATMNGFAFVILAFPQILALIAITAFWGTALWKITLIIGIGSIPLIYRVVRASTLAFVNREFVVAARALGASPARIIFRELLPNVLPAALSFAMIGVAGAIVLEGTLAFLGLSVPLPTPSWGNMIAEGSTNGQLQQNIYIMLWPAISMFLLLLSINLIGDRLRQRFDVRESLV